MHILILIAKSLYKILILIALLELWGGAEREGYHVLLLIGFVTAVISSIPYNKDFFY